MDKPMIGIRQADGSFYEIMDEAQAGHKRLVLSAARTDQRGVRIDLYRSHDGTLDASEALGEIAIDDPEGLGFQDIEFHLDIDQDGKLTASAALPGQPPQTLSVDLGTSPTSRGDREILGDESLDDAEVDVLAEDFNPESEVEPMTLDFPELEDPEVETPRRSDSAILDDESLADVELDSLDNFGLDEEVPATDPDLDDEFSMDDLDAEPETSVPAAAESFDLGDLDAGFGDDADSLGGEGLSPEAEAIDDWEKISLDDMEPMEFMDTGAEISKPSEKKPSSPQPAKAESLDDFSMEDDEPLELGDFDSEFTDLSHMEADDGLDHDFMAPPELTDPEPWEGESETSSPSKAGKAAKPGKATKAPKAPKASRPEPTVRDSGAGLDKAALFLSLTALSLLVILVLVLLFLNMIRPAPVPSIQPEVMRWKPSSSLEPMAKGNGPSDIDLGSPNAPHFEASSILEVPQGLKGSRVSLRLAPGEAASDAADRFGPPARVEGTLLSW